VIICEIIVYLLVRFKIIKIKSKNIYTEYVRKRLSADGNLWDKEGGVWIQLKCTVRYKTTSGTGPCSADRKGAANFCATVR